MPPRQRPPCVICQHQTSKYTCASCRAHYCCVACYKQHTQTCSPGSMGAPGADVTSTASESRSHDPRSNLETSPDPKPNDSSLPPDPQPPRSLTTLRWPYVPDTSAYPDPLTRDDPKPLQMNQYEVIATSPKIRTLLTNPRLCTLLTTIDAQRGAEREEALQRALGVNSRLLKNDDVGVELDEDTKVLRAFAEAIEEAVRGGREDVLGLDWD
ncbi:hypothetical protein L210DRAFT_3621608 [Boletus edulis BED1]|uniref:HIT-type domain-containing protein n=1 Tax=Boletus edulis BED1 TaxID=1328754 RepID=A0AAD4GE96_BOLED|nr:hypothetical protein L210DRAFT_3621608 [Boletus edulis BED1]